MCYRFFSGQHTDSKKKNSGRHQVPVRIVRIDFPTVTGYYWKTFQFFVYQYRAFEVYFAQ